MNTNLSTMVSGAKQLCVTAGKKIKTVVMDPRFVAVMLLLVICTVSVEAQSMDSGVKAISTASDSIKKYLPVVVKLIYVIAGIVAVLGAISVYIKNEQRGTGCQEVDHDDRRCLYLPHCS